MLKFAFKVMRLRILFVCSLLFAIGIPLFISFVIQPHYQRLIVQGTESDAILLASHLTSDEIREKIPLLQSSFTQEDYKTIDILKEDFKIFKIKIFAPDGGVVFSTQTEDIGKINQNAYFKDIVAQGQVYTKTVKKNQKSMENENMPIDVVECYVPIMIDGRFHGAFEIYQDITQKRVQIEILNNKVGVWVLTFSVFFMGVVLLFLWFAGSDLHSRQVAQQEKEKLIRELSSALGKIKTLRGMIPMCSHCKKIRDDQGYWNRIESYINVSSGSDLSHSICPECAKKYYPDVNPYDD